MDKPMRLPQLPPVGTKVMETAEKRELFDILRGIPKDELWRAEVQELVRQGYARIWAHLCLAAGFAPPEAANCTCRRHREVLPAFCRAVGKIGLHEPVLVPDYHAPQVAILAAELYRTGGGACGASPPGPPAAGAPALRSGGALPALPSQGHGDTGADRAGGDRSWVDALAPAGAFRGTVRTSRVGRGIA